MRKLVLAVLWVLFLAMSVPALAQPVKSPMIAVSAIDKTASASVSGQAGRSPFFLFFDKQGTLVEAVANPYKDAGNAGIPTLDFLAGKGVTVVVAEEFGSRIVEVMKGKGMRAVEFKGNAKDAVKRALELK